MKKIIIPKFVKSLCMQPPRWADWIVTLLMSYAASVIAIYIHEFLVLHRGTRLYQLMIDDLYNPNISIMEYLPRLFLIFSITALPSFLVLLFFRRKQVLHRWTALIIIIIFWINFLCETAPVKH